MEGTVGIVAVRCTQFVTGSVLIVKTDVDTNCIRGLPTFNATGATRTTIFFGLSTNGGASDTATMEIRPAACCAKDFSYPLISLHRINKLNAIIHEQCCRAISRAFRAFISGTQ